MIGSRWKWWPGESDYPTKVTVVRLIDANSVEVCYSDEYDMVDQLVSGEDTWIVNIQELSPDA